MIPVVVAVPCGEQGRWSVFWEALGNLELPEGAPRPIVYHGGVLANARNKIVRKAKELGAERIFWLDDDMLFSPNVLSCLMKHDKDIVVGLTLHREPPFYPIIYKRMNERGQCYPRYLNKWESGLHKVDAATMGGILTKTSVFDRIPEPWFVNGEIEPDGISEDLSFGRRCKNAGIDIWCDFDVPFGHISTCVMWPMKQPDGNWVSLIMKNELAIAVPSAASPLAVK